MFLISIDIVYLWISNTEAYVGGYPRIAGHTQMTIVWIQPNSCILQEATPTHKKYRDFITNHLNHLLGRSGAIRGPP